MESMQARPKSERQNSHPSILQARRGFALVELRSLCRVTRPDETVTGGRTSRDDLRFVHCALSDQTQTATGDGRLFVLLVHSHASCRVFSRSETCVSGHGDGEVGVEVDAVPLNACLSTFIRADGTSLTAVEAVVPIGEKVGMVHTAVTGPWAGTLLTQPPGLRPGRGRVRLEPPPSESARELFSASQRAASAATACIQACH